MTANISKQPSSLFRFLLGAAAFTILILAMRMGASFWNPILLALVLAITIAPALGWLQGKGLPAWLALLIVVITLVVWIILSSS
jgi:predicted PurR-regulated permease PerM